MHHLDTTTQLAAMRRDELVRAAARQRAGRVAGRRSGRRDRRRAWTPGA